MERQALTRFDQKKSVTFKLKAEPLNRIKEARTDTIYGLEWSKVNVFFYMLLFVSIQH